MTPTRYRPDDRDPAIVWHWFEKAFEDSEFPNVGWALGSDWGMGSRVLSAEQYKAKACGLMTELYGPKPR